MKHKKGQIVIDLLYMGIILIVMVVIILVTGSFFKDINTKYQSNNIPNNSTGKVLLNDMSNRYSTIFDNLFFAVVILMGIALLFSLFLINSHPALFFLIVILLLFGIIVLATFGNFIELFTNSQPIASEASNYPVLNFVFDNWITIMVTLGFTALVVFFAKVNRGMFA